MKRVRSLFYAALASSPMMAGTPAHAFDETARQRSEQTTAGGTDVEPVDKLIALQSSWTKLCGEDKEARKQVCYTTLVFGPAPGNEAIAFAVYDVKGEDKQILRFLVGNKEPTGLNIGHGVKVSIGRGDAVDAAFIICLQDGCYAEAKVQRKFVDSLMKSPFVRISFWKKDRNPDYLPGNILVSFDLPMAGFGAAFNGPPVSPAEFKRSQAQQPNADTNGNR